MHILKKNQILEFRVKNFGTPNEKTWKRKNRM